MRPSKNLVSLSTCGGWSESFSFAIWLTKIHWRINTFQPEFRSVRINPQTDLNCSKSHIFLGKFFPEKGILIIKLSSIRSRQLFFGLYWISHKPDSKKFLFLLLWNLMFGSVLRWCSITNHLIVQPHSNPNPTHFMAFIRTNLCGRKAYMLRFVLISQGRRSSDATKSKKYNTLLWLKLDGKLDICWSNDVIMLLYGLNEFFSFDRLGALSF